MARFDLTDFEWSVIAPLLPNKPRGVARVDDRRVLKWYFLAAAHRCTLGRHPAALRAAYDVRESLQPVAQSRGVGSHSGGSLKGLRWRYPDDRLLVDPRASACRQRKKSDAIPLHGSYARRADD